MAKGRRPKATAARVREGGTGRNGAVSHRPQPSTELVEVAGRNVPVTPPPELEGDAAALWEEIVRVLADVGILDKVDLPALRLFCVQYQRAWTAKRFLDEPLEADEVEELRTEELQMTTISNALKQKIGGVLKAGLTPDTKDLNASANYATALTNLRLYRRTLERHGRIVSLGSTGQLVEHPLLGTERQAAALGLRFASAFGITPTDRARLGLLIVDVNKGRRELDDEIGARPKR